MGGQSSGYSAIPYNMLFFSVKEHFGDITLVLVWWRSATGSNCGIPALSSACWVSIRVSGIPAL